MSDEFVTAIVAEADFIPRCQDAGYDVLIGSLAPKHLDRGPFMTVLNVLGAFPLTWEMFLEYLSDRQAAGACAAVRAPLSAMPMANTRADAPTGLGIAAWGVWFSTPDSGTKMVRWYKNGALVVEREQDLATNRSITVDELGGILSGDVVQVCIVESGVVGWWARI